MTDTRRHLADLVAIDSTSRTSNLPLLAYVEDLLAHHGIPSTRGPDPTGTKANLVARIGPAIEGGIVLAAHTDCVPVEGQSWTTDPFTLTARGDRLHARGATDMKGFLASVLAQLPTLAAAPLTRPVLLVLTYDEEIGTVGGPSAVELLLSTQPRPEAVIVGEPTLLQPVTAHKGVRSFTTIVEGRDGHSSQPHLAANALTAAARIATFIADLAARHRDAAAAPDFDPPYTTFNLASLHAGQAINIVPRRAELTWEYRPVPADDSDALVAEVERYAAEEVLPELRATTGEGEITFRHDAIARGLAPEPGGAAEALVRRLTGGGGPAGSVPFGTDGGHFQAAGLSTVVCGPGSIEQAHQPDEWIATEQLVACDAMLAALTRELST
ncbi:MAG: acetylornithine deacetylase [Nitriliruptor sp.]|nr:MAG: acetylornithine deacetylase [Nitriliruptor sp.]